MARDDISATITTFLTPLFPRNSNSNVNTLGSYKIGHPQIWKPMKLSKLEKRIQQTLPNLKKRIQKWPILLPRSGRARSTRGQANEARAMYKSTPFRVSWGDPSSETQGRSVGSGKTAAKVLKTGRGRPWNATLNEAVLQLIEFLSVIFLCPIVGQNPSRYFFYFLMQRNLPANSYVRRSRLAGAEELSSRRVFSENRINTVIQHVSKTKQKEKCTNRKNQTVD